MSVVPARMGSPQLFVGHGELLDQALQAHGARCLHQDHITIVQQLGQISAKIIQGLPMLDIEGLAPGGLIQVLHVFTEEEYLIQFRICQRPGQAPMKFCSLSAEFSDITQDGNPSAPSGTDLTASEATAERIEAGLAL